MNRSAPAEQPQELKGPLSQNSGSFVFSPVATDFLLHDLPNIIDALASNFIGRTAPLQGREPIRVYLTGSILVSFVAIYAAESADSSVDLLWIDIDRSE